jgi:PAS domain S-box-containing protein
MPDRLKIYIVEDDDDARESLKDILELDDHQVTVFSTAQDAMEYDRFANVDVVLMDRRLPDGLAEELLPQLKAMAKDTDFIVITGFADMNAAIAALREGISDYLIKPVDPDALRATLSRLAKRRAVERELYRQRRFAEKLLETAEAIILVMDPKGRVLRANPYLLELTGYTLEEVIEADWIEKFVPDRDRDRIAEVFAQTVRQFKSRGIMGPIRTKDGRECEIRWSNTTLRNTDGKTTAVISVGLDLTDYVQAQRQLLQNERLAAIGQTMTGLAHESRNALQRLQNAVELLQEDLRGQPQALSDLAKIERAGHDIHNLLEEVRAYAAPVNLHLEPASLPRIWRRAWRSIEHRLEGANVTFQDASRCGEDSEQTRVRIDCRRMEQVFRNLFENALDAAEGPLHLTVSCRSTPDSIEVTIADDGPGVSETFRGKLFNAFASTKPTGTGLGLAICRRTVEAHGGQLQLESSEAGATFVIKLPKSRYDESRYDETR